MYGTKLTIALIEHKLEEHRLLKNTKRKVMKHGQSVNLGCFRVEFIKTNHSIQEASALAIFTPVGTVLHTGDFKIDYTPVFGDPIDLQRFAELGKKGVLALMADSTNALRPGFTMSERTVGRTFDTIFAEHQNRRIIVATFASNVDRVQQVVNTAYKYGRKVVVEGRSMVTIMDIASKLGYINVPDGTLIDIEQLKNYPPESTVLITTGSQGESMAALSRMASNIHKKVSIMPGDVVVLSSTPIPGNEKAVANVVNELAMKGAEVICQDTHVSGHACQEDLKLIYSLVQPKFSIPVHGEYRHRMAQKELAIHTGVDKDHAVLINSGDVLALDGESCQVIDHVPCGGIFVDGLGVGDVGNIVLRDRQNLAQNGIIIVVLTLEKHSNQLLAGPDIVSRGFVYVRESEDLLEEAHSVVYRCDRGLLGSSCERLGQDKEYHQGQFKRLFVEAHEAQSYDPADHHGSIAKMSRRSLIRGTPVYANASLGIEEWIMSNRTREINKITMAIIRISVKLMVYALIILLLYEAVIRGYAFGHAVFFAEAVDAPPGKTVTVQMSGEESVSQAAKKLAGKGLIKSEFAFLFQSKFYDYDTIYPGSYELNTSMTSKEILQILNEDPQDEKGVESRNAGSQNAGGKRRQRKRKKIPADLVQSAQCLSRQHKKQRAQIRRQHKKKVQIRRQPPQQCRMEKRTI